MHVVFVVDSSPAMMQRCDDGVTLFDCAKCCVEKFASLFPRSGGDGFFLVTNSSVDPIVIGTHDNQSLFFPRLKHLLPVGDSDMGFAISQAFALLNSTRRVEGDTFGHGWRPSGRQAARVVVFTDGGEQLRPLFLGRGSVPTLALASDTDPLSELSGSSLRWDCALSGVVLSARDGAAQAPAAGGEGDAGDVPRALRTGSRDHAFASVLGAGRGGSGPSLFTAWLGLEAPPPTTAAVRPWLSRGGPAPWVRALSAACEASGGSLRFAAGLRRAAAEAEALAHARPAPSLSATIKARRGQERRPGVLVLDVPPQSAARLCLRPGAVPRWALPERQWTEEAGGTLPPRAGSATLSVDMRRLALNLGAVDELSRRYGFPVDEYPVRCTALAEALAREVSLLRKALVLETRARVGRHANGDETVISRAVRAALAQGARFLVRAPPIRGAPPDSDAFAFLRVTLPPAPSPAPVDGSGGGGGGGAALPIPDLSLCVFGVGGLHVCGFLRQPCQRAAAARGLTAAHRGALRLQLDDRLRGALGGFLRALPPVARAAMRPALEPYGAAGCVGALPPPAAGPRAAVTRAVARQAAAQHALQEAAEAHSQGAALAGAAVRRRQREAVRALVEAVASVDLSAETVQGGVHDSGDNSGGCGGSLPNPSSAQTGAQSRERGRAAAAAVAAGGGPAAGAAARRRGRASGSTGGSTDGGTGGGLGAQATTATAEDAWAVDAAMSVRPRESDWLRPSLAAALAEAASAAEAEAAAQLLPRTGTRSRAAQGTASRGVAEGAGGGGGGAAAALAPAYETSAALQTAAAAARPDLRLHWHAAVRAAPSTSRADGGGGGRNEAPPLQPGEEAAGADGEHVVDVQSMGRFDLFLAGRQRLRQPLSDDSGASPQVAFSSPYSFRRNRRRGMAGGVDEAEDALLVSSPAASTPSDARESPVLVGRELGRRLASAFRVRSR